MNTTDPEARADDTDDATSAEPAAGDSHVKPIRRPRHQRTLAFLGGATAGALVLGIGGYAYGAASTAITEQSVASQAAPAFVPRQPPGIDPFASGSQDAASAQTAPETATADQMAGVVTILSELYYGEGQSAGTGIVLTADGTILTNNHVIEGATSIEVTVESTGDTYSASVVGTDDSNDIAILKLEDASGLATATLEQSEELGVGDEVTAVGNAEGTGTLVAASGTVTDLDESITVGDELTGEAEKLDGLIEVDAYVVSGDSGGPLLDDDGDVVGVVTAASAGTAVVGYAIDIDEAIAIWQTIEAGEDTETVEIGVPAFLGILLGSATPSSTGVRISGVIDGTPAAEAGLGTGDILTAVDGVAVSTAGELSALIAEYEPGDWVTLSFTDAAGVAHGATVTLAEGPAA